jgi:hypothetical protein
MYIPSHQELRDHPKVKRLARILDTSIPAAIGHLHCLWWWALDYAPDGDVSRYDEFDLADAGMWEGDPGTFVKALQQCGPGGTAGFLDDAVLHDWPEYGGKMVAKREADRARKARSRQSDVPGTSDGGHGPPSNDDGDVSDGRPRDVRVTAHVDKRREEETRETPPSPPAGAVGDGESLDFDDDAVDDGNAEADRQFEEHFWPAYPARHGRKEGKADAKAKWRKLTIEQRRRALIGARNLARSDQLPKNAQRFLTKSRAGAWPFDDWQEPPAPTNGRDDSREVLV